ncbi:MAG TPA: metal ABC transporter substrate-binding protein [Methylomirabilota bacterium]
MTRSIWLALGAIALASCGQDVGTPTDRPLVVASFYPHYEFARQVAGNRAEVVSLVPTGVEPHDWEPSPQDVVRIEHARVFVYNGAGYERWIDRLAGGIRATGAVVVRATEGIDLLPADRRGERTAVSDPHVWLDPLLAQHEVEAIRAALGKADPAHETEYADHARAFTARLAGLDEAYAKGLAQCLRRDLIVSHDAFGYLARRYRLLVVSLMGLAPDAEPSPAELASIVRLAQRRGVKYVFFETLVSPKLADTLAHEVGARTLVLNPIEGRTHEEAAAGMDYVELMEANLKNLRIALECR